MVVVRLVVIVGGSGMVGCEIEDRNGGGVKVVVVMMVEMIVIMAVVMEIIINSGILAIMLLEY